MAVEGQWDRPRFPGLPRAAGHYESFYLRACRPGGGLGVWIRYTILKRPGRDPTGSCWFTLFDADAPEPLASKVTLPAAEILTGPEILVGIGESRLAPGRATGRAASPACDASWDLAFAPTEESLPHLPKAWMYRTPLPRTKSVSLHPTAIVQGTVNAGERRIDLEGWIGMVGHNWGTEHAERWIWMHGSGFEGHGPDTWLDVVIGRVRIGPATTPWIASGAVSLKGERMRLGGPARTRALKVREQPQECEFVLPGASVTVRGRTGADPKRIVAWRYSDPSGGEHHTANCSIADMELTLERPGRGPIRITAPGGAAYELGMREKDHGLPLQPFSDD